MAHCAHHHPAVAAPAEWLSFLGLNAETLSNWGGGALILTLFLTGLASSFTHCIGMCGPIAMAQMSMRLMNLPGDKLNQQHKLHCALSLPYYLGKAFTYVVLCILAMILSVSVKNVPYIKYAAIPLLIIAALVFLKLALSKTFQLIDFQPKFKKNFGNWIAKKVSMVNLSPFGFQGFMMGMALGLIPCGMVYGAIATILSDSLNYMIALISMFAFGIATIPGLFIVSYLGQRTAGINKHLFSIFYSIMMLINAYLLISHAMRLWK